MHPRQQNIDNIHASRSNVETWDHMPAKHPRLAIIEYVLESAKCAEEDFAIAACRRLIEAHRLGWKKHHRPADWRLVQELYEALRS